MAFDRKAMLDRMGYEEDDKPGFIKKRGSLSSSEKPRMATVKNNSNGTVDLGDANGWKNTPDIIEKCNKLGHKKSYSNIGKSYEEIKCGICGYVYRVDSSD
jgi:hypothetical protein